MYLYIGQKLKLVKANDYLKGVGAKDGEISRIDYIKIMSTPMRVKIKFKVGKKDRHASIWFKNTEDNDHVGQIIFDGWRDGFNENYRGFDNK